MHDVLVKIENVHKSFGQGSAAVPVLKGITLDVNAGEIVLIIGPSGSGKSTLLSFIGAIDTPSSGSVTVYGKNLTALDSASTETLRNKHIGFVFQFHYLLPEFSVLENIMMPGTIAGMPFKNARTRGTELLHLIDMVDRAKQMPDQLSGGERQRAALARAFFNRPGLIIADEPTGNLDCSNVENIMNLIKRERTENGRTFVIATHDQRLSAIADRVITLKDGICYES